jgi:hypothetical protein
MRRPIAFLPGVIFGDGQQDREIRSFAGAGVQPDMAVTLPDNAKDCGQTHPRSLVYVFGGKKGFKDLVQDLRSDSRPGVADLDTLIISWGGD